MMPASSPMNGAAPPGMPPQMPPPMPPMPSHEQLEQDALIAEACSWEEVSAILRSDDRRNYSIDVETDATALEDEEADKASAIEYVKAMTEMMQLWIPAIQGNPSLAPMAKELAVFVSGKFKPGRQFEEQLGDAFDQIQNTPPQPNPEAEAAKAEMAMKQQDMQAKAQATQADMAFKQQDAQLKQKQAEGEFAMKSQELAAELEFKRQELGIKMQELEFKKQSAAFDMQLKQQEAQTRNAEAEQRFAMDAEDKQHSRMMAEADHHAQAEERGFKRQDMEERRHADIQDKTERREMEAGFTAGKVGDHVSKLSEKVISAEAERQGQERDGLRQEVTAVAQQLLTSNERLAEAMHAVLVKQDQTQEALLAAITRMGAPRKVRRDPKTGRVDGFDLMEENAA